MSEIDQQFIEYVVKSLVGKPDAVHIDRRIDEKGVLLELTVDPEDLGRVIGKRGATAQSLRTLLRALGTKNDARYNLKIVDNGTGSTNTHSQSVSDQTTDSPVPTVDDQTHAIDYVTEDEKVQEDQTSDRLKAARAELADLDDLDV
ncbi:MAG TPA: KH domain-containing protein [Candidatus Saccharimonadales bacterium]|nr:KH domain-containing protein [Candidatus Saccharimonadales bacterium]